MGSPVDNARKTVSSAYWKIAESVKNLVGRDVEFCELLERGNAELPKDVIGSVMGLYSDAASDRDFFAVAGIPYADGLTKRLFFAAASDHFLRMQNTVQPTTLSFG